MLTLQSTSSSLHLSDDSFWEVTIANCLGHNEKKKKVTSQMSPQKI